MDWDGSAERRAERLDDAAHRSNSKVCGQRLARLGTTLGTARRRWWRRLGTHIWLRRTLKTARVRLAPDHIRTCGGDRIQI